MGVVVQIARPCLQDTDHAEGAADVFWVGGQFLEGLLAGICRVLPSSNRRPQE